MPVDCTPQSLAADSSDFCCIVQNPPVAEAVKLYLLRAIAGLQAMSPDDLQKAATCFFSCVPDGMQKAVQSYLLCQIANGGGGPGTCSNLSGADSPLNNITPDFVGQVYVQGDGSIWQAGSLLSSSWTVIGASGANVFNYDGPSGTDLSSTALTALTTDFWITGPGGSGVGTGTLTTITLPSLATVSGFFDIDSLPELASLDLTGLTTVGGGIFFDSLAILSAIALPSLTIVTGDSVIANCTLLASIDLPLMTALNGNLDASNNPALVTVNVPVWLPTNGTTLDFSGDALDAASVNQILARCVASGVTTCTIDLSGGTNAAPSGQGIIDKATLITAGNTVTTN